MRTKFVSQQKGLKKLSKVDKRFVLIADNGDRLYPYIKIQKSTSRQGFALTKPGEQDRHGQGTYTKDIQEVIRHLVFDGWSVRAKTIDKTGRQREGTFGISKLSISGYEVAEEFQQLINSATQKPISIVSKSKLLEPEKSIGREKNDSLNERPIDEKVLREIKSRRGQPDFRKALLALLKGKCCISGCNVENVLEAAHIVPHSEVTNYSVSNGLLLRADLHTLYDLNLIGINLDGKIYLSSNLIESDYWVYHGQFITTGISEVMSDNLKLRFATFNGS